MANSEESDTLLFADYLLGWLNGALVPLERTNLETDVRFVTVNTRCVFFDLGGKTSDSLTLAPIIDMVRSDLKSVV